MAVDGGPTAVLSRGVTGVCVELLNNTFPGCQMLNGST